MWNRLASIVSAVLIGLTVALFPAPTAMAAEKHQEEWDVTEPRGRTRTIEFTIDEGTWMSVDISPDGEWIVFDLLAHIYRVPATGGKAELLTGDSGIALNSQPRYAPDGSQIAFITDREGQLNLWVMDADGSDPRPVVSDINLWFAEPTWTPDGEFLIVQRSDIREDAFRSTVWMYHRDGGEGVELLGGDASPSGAASVSPDGMHLYYHSLGCPFVDVYGKSDIFSGCFQISRMNLTTGEVDAITAGRVEQQDRSSSGGALAPEISPDGRWLSFARRIPDGKLSFKGHEVGPRTALWLRDLESGAERILMDPIEFDLGEIPLPVRVLPHYAWMPNGRSIVIAQGGKIRRVQVDDGQVQTIPFTAEVRRTISERVYAPFRIDDGPFEARALRWHTGSPDGSRLAFQAVGKIWVQDLPNGRPARLTPDSFEPSEFSPAWSLDGSWVAFTTRDEQGGHLWKMSAEGGEPIRLTDRAGEYIHPIWSPDARQIVVVRGAGATARGRTWARNPWYELVRLSASGGPVETIVRVKSTRFYDHFIVRASFGADGRLFYPEPLDASGPDDPPSMALVSVRLDGSDRRVHHAFPYADEMAVSPDGRRLAYQDGDNVYLIPLPMHGTAGQVPESKRGAPVFHIEALSKTGGLYPRWRDAQTVEFGSGPIYYTHDVETGTTRKTPVRLSVPRHLPQGSIALRGARIVTLEGRRVIEAGDVVIRDGRISCVGRCDGDDADRVVDVTGKTIIPGFIDLHGHHSREHRGIYPLHNYESAVYVAYGVTTTLDPYSWTQNVFTAAELTEAGLMVGPRHFGAGDGQRPGSARADDMTDYDVVERTVERLTSWGAVSIKQYVQPRRDQRQWFAEAARKHDVMLTAEGSLDLNYNLGMAMDGYTSFEHLSPELPLYTDVTRFLGRAGHVMAPTFVVGSLGPWNEEYFFQEGELWKDPKQRRFQPWRQLVPHTRRHTVRPETDYMYPLMSQAVADVIAEGGYGVIGSHGQAHGIGSHWEVWMAAEASGPMGALEIGSLHGAYRIGIDRDTGSIAPGKLADLMVLNSNPLDDIRNTLDIRYVMKAGVLRDGETLHEIWPHERPFPRFDWDDDGVYRDDVRPVDFWDRTE